MYPAVPEFVRFGKQDDAFPVLEPELADGKIVGHDAEIGSLSGGKRGLSGPIPSIIWPLNTTPLRGRYLAVFAKLEWSPATQRA